MSDEGTKRYLLVCSCSRMDKKAVLAFSTLFPNEHVPEVVRGRDRIYKLAHSLGNEHVKAISRLSGKFAYYIKINKANIVEEWDLQRGKKVA